MESSGFSDEWYKQAWALEEGVDVSAGPACFNLYDGEIESKADQILAAGCTCGGAIGRYAPRRDRAAEKNENQTTGPDPKGVNVCQPAPDDRSQRGF